ncbi:MAG: hypothetical protein ACK40G_01115 [Cytophagaceae bacterium]
MRLLKFFLTLIILIQGKLAYSQCQVSLTKSDVTCNGGNNGTASVTVSGLPASNNCIAPGTPSITCNSTFSRTISNNVYVSVVSGETVKIEASSFTSSIDIGGGTLVICGNINPSNFNINGGNVIIIGTLSVSNIQVNNNANFRNYGTINLTNLDINSGEVENHGTMNLNGNLTNNSRPILNRGTLNITGNFQNGGNFTNNGQFTAGSVNGFTQATFVNTCTVNVSGNFSSAGLNNSGSFNIGGSLTVSGNFTTTRSITVGNTMTFDHGNNSTIGEGVRIQSQHLMARGNISKTGSACSQINVNQSGNAVFDWGLQISGNIEFCYNSNNAQINGSTIIPTGCACTNFTTTSVSCSYSWSNGSTGQSVSNLTAGNHSVTVTCGSCVVTENFTITQPQNSLSVTLNPSTSCQPNNASILTNVSGGTPPYSYLWNNGASTSTLSGLSSGVYSVQVKDANNCVSNTSVTIQQASSPLTVNKTVSEILCHGDNSGAINLTVSGGVSPYSYVWNNGSQSQNLSNLGPGTYSVTITDANQCQVSNSTVLIDAEPLDVVINTTDVTRFGLDDGTATVVVNNFPDFDPIQENCSPVIISPENCISGCTNTVNSDLSNLNVNAGEKVCLTSTSFTGNINISGGTLVICGNISPANINTNGGTIIINGTLTLSNLNLNNNLLLKNYGTIISGSIGINNGELQNYKDITASSVINVNHPCLLNNKGNISTNELNNSNSIVNDGQITVGSNFTNNGGSIFTNNCSISVNATFTNNGTTNNNGRIVVNTLSHLNGGSILNLGAKSELISSNINLIGTINGHTGQGCSSVKVSGTLVVNGGASISGAVSVCSENTQNNEPSIAQYLNCNCDNSIQSCSYQWSNGSTGQSITNLDGGVYSVVVTCGNCSQTKTFEIIERAYLIINTVNVSPGTYDVFAPGITTSANSGGIDSELIIEPNLPVEGSESIIDLKVQEAESSMPLDIQLKYNWNNEITSVKAKVQENFLEINCDYYDIKINEIYFYNEKPQNNLLEVSTNLVNGKKLNPVTKTLNVYLPNDILFENSTLKISKINSTLPISVYGPSSSLTWDASSATAGVYQFELDLVLSGQVKVYKAQFIIE